MQSNLFSYTGLSMRVSAKNRAGAVTTFMRDGAGVTAPVISDTNASYTPGISERRGGVTTFQHSGIKNNDAQSVVAQTVSATREYDAFGNVASSAGTFAGPFGYGGIYGYQSDTETGYKLLGHRYCDSETGRFLTRDPAYDGRNWYVYCDNNPLTSADPSGRSALTRLLKKVIKIGLKNGTEVQYLVMKNMGDAKRAAHQLDPSGEVVKHCEGHGNPLGPGHYQNLNRPEIHVTWEGVADGAGELPGSVWANWRNLIASCVAFLDPTGISDAMEAGELAGEVLDPYAKKWRAGLEHYRIGRWLGDD